MHDTPIHWDNNRLCSFYDAVDVLLVDFTVSFTFIGNGDDTAGIESFDVSTAYPGYAVSNFHTGHHLCSFDRIVDPLYGFFDIDNGSFS